MNLKLNQRGFVLVEFAIALPLLILLLYALGTLNVGTAKISREQVADYVLETEAQEIIDRIVTDARSAHSVEIKNEGNFDRLILRCHSYPASTEFKDILDTRIYAVHSANGKRFHIYFKHVDDNNFNNPITGDNFFGDTFVTEFKFLIPKKPTNEYYRKVLHIDFEITNVLNNKPKQKVKFSTAVFMPACKKIIYHGNIIFDETNETDE